MIARVHAPMKTYALNAAFSKSAVDLAAVAATISIEEARDERQEAGTSKNSLLLRAAAALV